MGAYVRTSLKMASMNDDPPLTPAEQAMLLALARAGLRADVSLDDANLPPALQRPAGAFVTLHSGGKLRGCIGSPSAGPPLARLVAELAVSAATRDPRFPPVTAAEIDGLHIEISVLGAPVALQHASQVEVDRHGLIVGRGSSRGLLLPQVATEQGWDAGAFLSHTCLKAGLPGDAWQDWDAGKDPDFSVEAFTAQVFGEKPD